MKCQLGFSLRRFAVVMVCAGLFWSLVSASGHCASKATSASKEVPTTLSDRAYALIHLLKLTAEQPTEIYFDMLSRVAVEAEAPALAKAEVDIVKRNAAIAATAAALPVPAMTPLMEERNGKLSMRLIVGDGTVPGVTPETLLLSVSDQNGVVSVTGIPKALTAIYNLKGKGVPDAARSALQASLNAQSVPTSPNLLKPVGFTSTYGFSVLNNERSNQYFEHSIFSGPAGLCAFKYEDLGNPSADNDFLFVADANWNRIVYAGVPLHGGNNGYPWILDFGDYGTGDGKFKHPTAIDMVGFKMFVADAYNNRVTAYNVSQEMPNLGFLFPSSTITNGLDGTALDYVPDLACAWIPPRANLNNPYPAEISIIDQGHKKIQVFRLSNDQCISTRTINAADFGAYALQRPTAIAYGRNVADNLPITYFYVCDSDARRVVAKSTDQSITVVYATPPDAFPANAYLTSVDCDWYGYVYVLDETNGEVRVFDPSLENQIAAYGPKGRGDGQLWYPQSIARQFGWRKGTDGKVTALNVGGVVISELWGTNTGIRNYVQSFDLLNANIIYHPVPEDKPLAVDHLWISWNQSGPANVTAYLYDNYQTCLDDAWLGQQIDPTYYGLNAFATLSPTALTLPGFNWRDYRFPTPPDPSQGSLQVYGVMLHATSPYSGDSRVLMKSFEVERKTNPCASSEVPLYVTGSTMIDPETGLPVTEVYAKPAWKHLAVDVRVGCTDPNATVIYRWKSGQYGTTMYTTDPNSGTAFSKISTTMHDIYAWYRQPAGLADVDETDRPIACVEFCFIAANGDTVPYQQPTPAPAAAVTPLTISCYHTFFADYKCVPTGSGQMCPPDPPLPTGCPFLYAWDGFEYRLVNNVLAQSEDPVYASQTRADFLVLPNLINVPGNDIRLEIREEADEVTTLDAISASALLVPTTMGRVGFTDRGRFITLRDEVLPVRAVTDFGENVLLSLLFPDTNAFTSSSAGWLEVEYSFGTSPVARGPAPTMLTTTAPPGSIGELDPPKDPANKPVSDPELLAKIVTVKYLASDGSWMDVARLAPRVTECDTRVEFTGSDNPNPLVLRIEWTTGLRIDYLPYIIGEPVNVVPTPLSLESADHSTGGDVRSAVSGVGGDSVIINSGEKLSVSFGKPTLGAGQEALFVLKAIGEYRRAGDTVSHPISFEFDQNYPNPFNPSTSFSFGLPTACHVTLDVYNVLGQKVATVTDRVYSAGRHRVVWDGQGANGRQVGSGVYFARLRAGDRTATRKMVVVK